MAKEDIEILTSELSLFKKMKADSDDIQLNVILALNSVISSGHELLALKRDLEIPEAGDTAALSTLFDAAGARVSRTKDAVDALVDSRRQAMERIKQAEKELETMPQESSTVASKWSRKKSQTKPTDELEKARSALAFIDINLETAEEKHGDAEARLNELLTQHHAQIKERQEMIAQATQRYDHMKEAYIAAAAAAAATVSPATATAATTTAVSDPTATLAAAAAQLAAAHQGVFAPLTLTDTDAKDVSHHESKTAKAVYTFVLDPCVKGAVSTFQEKCLESPKVAGFIVAPAPLDSDRLEDDFATRLVRTLAPRFEVVLTEVLGLTDVNLKKLFRTHGVDMTLSALDPHDVRHPLILPIEVKGYLGTGTPHVSTEARANNYLKNKPCLDALCDGLARRNTLNIWKAVTQTAWYIQNEANSNNRGVVFSKDGVLLLHRMNHNTVYMSGLIEYKSVDPHPVAAVAFWIQESVLSPSRVLNPDYPDTVSIQPAAGTGASTRSESGSPGGGSGPSGGGSGPSGGSGLGRSGGSTPRKRSRLAKEYRMPSYDDDDNGDFQPDNRGQKKGKERQYGEYPTDVEHDLLHNSSTTAVDAGMKRFSTYMHTLGTFVDTSSAELEFVGSSRCGKVYVGDLGDGQPVVIKAAPADNDQNLDELNTEIRAYYRLSDLQGKVVPRVIAHGHCHIDGKLVGILAVERIEGEAILPPLDMDVRAALTELSDAERLACKDALAAIHKRGVAHGDVRGANLLFRRNHDGNALEPVFIDFGFSRFDTDAKFKETVKEDKLRLLDAFCGSSIYF